MGLSRVTDENAVRRSMRECDSMGRESFLEEFGFGATVDWVLVDGANAYDSKAIWGVAHYFEHGVLPRYTDFQGGKKDVVEPLRKMGFEVIGPFSQLPWSDEELVLALHLYLRVWATGYKKRDDDIAELSRKLRTLRFLPAVVRLVPKFRSPGSVYAKLGNFASLNSEFPGGLPNYGDGDERIWKLWASRPRKELNEEVERIYASASVVESLDSDDSVAAEIERYTALEGRIVYRTQRCYTRDRRLVAQKKAEVLTTEHCLACEVCGFNSEEAVGVSGVIDVHHVIPLHVRGHGETRLDDLALVCPTCHRLLHAHQPIITPKMLGNIRATRVAYDSNVD